MANKIQLRRDTTANWARVNPILDDGEPGLDIDLNKVKYGDGSTRWNQLPFSGAAPQTEPNRLSNNGSHLTLNSNGSVLLESGVTFENNTNITFPQGHVIGPGMGDLTLAGQGGVAILKTSGQNVTDTVFVGDGVAMTTARGTVQFGANLEAPGLPTHFHINKAGSFDLFLGDDSNYVKLPAISGVEVKASEDGVGTANWTFDALGKITVPRDGVITSVGDLSDATVSIANVSRSNPAVITLVSGTSDLNNSIAAYGSKVQITSVTGNMASNLNNNYYHLKYLSGDSYELYVDEDLAVPVDSTNWDIYGGRTNRTVTSNGATYSTADPFSPGSIEFTGGAKGQAPSMTVKDAGLNISGDFTLECFFYPRQNNNYNGIMATGASPANAEFVLHFGTDGALWGKFGNGIEQLSQQVTLNTWHHIALVRNISGGASPVVTLYLDGSAVTSHAVTDSALGDILTIGEGLLGNPQNFNGYMTNIRLSSVARYDIGLSSLTVPTASFTPDSDTVLLLACNSGVNPYLDTSPSPKIVQGYMAAYGTSTTTPYNTTGIANPETKLDILNAAYLDNIYFMGHSDRVVNLDQNWTDYIDVVESPSSGDTRFDRFFTLYGTTTFANGENYAFYRSTISPPAYSTNTPFDSAEGSISVGGGTYLTIPYSDDFQIGTSDFSVDFWVFQKDLNGYPRLFDFGYWTGTVGDTGEHLGISSEPGVIYAWLASQHFDFGVNGGLILNTWNHLAIARVDGVVSLYVNGVVTNSYTPNPPISIDMMGRDLTIGADAQGASTWNGFIRDFRLNVGASAFNGNFSVPTSIATATGSETKVLLNGINSTNFSQDFSNSVVVPGSAYATLITKTGEITIGTAVPAHGGDAGHLHLAAGEKVLSIAGTGAVTMPRDAEIKGYYKAAVGTTFVVATNAINDQTIYTSGYLDLPIYGDTYQITAGWTARDGNGNLATITSIIYDCPDQPPSNRATYSGTLNSYPITFKSPDYSAEVISNLKISTNKDLGSSITLDGNGVVSIATSIETGSVSFIKYSSLIEHDEETISNGGIALSVPDWQSYGGPGQNNPTTTPTGFTTDGSWQYVQFGDWDTTALNIITRGAVPGAVLPVTWAQGSTSQTGYVFVEILDFQTFQMAPCDAGGNNPAAGTWYFPATVGATSTVIPNSLTVHMGGTDYKFGVDGNLRLPNGTVAAYSGQKTIFVNATTANQDNIITDAASIYFVYPEYGYNDTPNQLVVLPVDGPLGTKVSIINCYGGNLDLVIDQNNGYNVVTLNAYENRDYVLIEEPGYGRYWWETNSYSW